MGVNFDRIGAIMKSARAIQTDSAKHRVCACIINRNYHTFFVLSSLRIQMNQTLSHFFFDHTGAKKKLTKRNAVLRGSAPHPATFEKVDETFRLLDASVGAVARKVSSFKVLRGCGGTFSKVPLRVPAYFAYFAYSAYSAFPIVPTSFR